MCVERPADGCQIAACLYMQKGLLSEPRSNRNFQRQLNMPKQTAGIALKVGGQRNHSFKCSRLRNHLGSSVLEQQDGAVLGCMCIA